MNKAPIEKEEKLKLSDVPKIIKGNARLEGETHEEYRERQKKRKRNCSE